MPRVLAIYAAGALIILGLGYIAYMTEPGPFICDEPFPRERLRCEGQYESVPKGYPTVADRWIHEHCYRGSQ